MQHAFLRRIEPFQEAAHLDSRVLERHDHLFRNAVVEKLLNHLVRIQFRHAAAVMSDNKHLLHIEIMDGDQQASHCAAEGLR
ncbi:hypothetical protein D3C84_1050620 [compost metagenome]